MQDILHGIGVDATLRALVDAARVEERRLVIAARGVGGKDDACFAENWCVHAFNYSASHFDAENNNETRKITFMKFVACDKISA